MDSNIIFPELPTYVGVPSLPGMVSLVLTVGLPILAGLFMRAEWSTFTKGLVLLAASAVKAFVEAWLVSQDTHTAFNVGQAAYVVLVQFGIAVIAHVGALRNTRIQRAALAGGVVRSRPQGSTGARRARR